MTRVAVLLSRKLVARHQESLLELDQVAGRLAQRALLHVLSQGAGQVGAAGHVVEVLRLHLLLVGLAVVEVVEVGDYHRDRQGDGEDARDRAQRPHYLAPDAHRPAGQREVG